MSFAAPHGIRPGEPADYPFIYSSWMKEERDRHPHLRTADYYARMTALVTTLLNRAELRIAHAREDEAQIFGWACLEREASVLHYVYVKATFRGVGLGSALLADVLTQPHRFTTTCLHPSRAPASTALLVRFEYEPLLLHPPLLQPEVHAHAAHPG